MIDVVLPCLNEAVAMPWVLSRIPDGFRAIVADSGSTDGSLDPLHARLGNAVVAPAGTSRRWAAPGRWAAAGAVRPKAR